MKPRDERVCAGTTKEHADAVRLVEYLIAHDGTVEITQDELARKLNFRRNLGGGVERVDTKRYHRARNHVRDRVDENGRPCCGYTLHYRKSGPESWLSLIDPTGDLGSHAKQAWGTVRGWVSRERQHHTENQRHVETLELLANHVLANNDRHGYRLLQRAEIEIEQNGTISPNTIAELDVWLSGMTA